MTNFVIVLQEGWTALMWSAYKGNYDCTALLLKKGASTNVYDTRHITPLIWASGKGYLQIAVILLAHASKPDAGDKVITMILHLIIDLIMVNMSILITSSMVRHH